MNDQPWRTVKGEAGTEIRIIPFGDPDDEERNCLVWQGGLLLAADMVYNRMVAAANRADLEAFDVLLRVFRRLDSLIGREQDIFDALVKEASAQ